MNMDKILRLSVLLIFFSFNFLHAGVLPKEEQLETRDVQRIMSKILRQHVSVHQVDEEILRRAMDTYLEQFDRSKIYLLEEEVAPYLHPTEEQLTQMMKEYERGQYQTFEEIHVLIQGAIERSRNWRVELADEMEQLLLEIEEPSFLEEQKKRDPFEEKEFVAELSDLKHRFREMLKRFLFIQRKQVGKKILHEKQTKAWALFERQLRDREWDYLFENEHGESVSADKQEDLFVHRLLKAFTRSLDAHTTFYNAEEAYDMRIRLEKGFKGIGVVLQESIDGIVITRLIEGGPAEKSGEIQPNDRLVEVDGVSIVDASFKSILELIRGAEGSSIYLGLKRQIEHEETQEKEDILVHVTLTRAEVVINEDRVDVSHENFGDGIIGKITLHAFYEGDNGISSERDVRDALKELYKVGDVKGIVLDLRENSGGFLIQAVKVAGLFISNGVIVVSRYSNGYERFFRDIDGHAYYEGPLVVLTSRASASAAEIVAQALQDYGAAVVVGDEQTYGKGSIQHQTVTGSWGSSFFKVTVGRFYTVSGRSTQIRGVKADIVVPTEYHDDQLGEQFLDYPLANDEIKPSYADLLGDVDEDVKSWYIKYYIPSLQQRKTKWTTILPVLKENSAYRLSHDENYKLFSEEIGIEVVDDEKEEEIENPYKVKKEENYGVEDMQMTEAVNIVKDMIYLDETGITEKQTETVQK